MRDSQTKHAITDTVADWIDPQVIVEAIENALETAELPKTKRHFREVWFIH